MENQHPTIPSPVLIKQWRDEWFENDRVEYSEYSYIATRAAAWGADQELRAVCQLLFSDPSASYTLSDICAARRPKAPSLKEQALALLDPSNTYGSITREEEYRISVANAETIRRALEQLDD